MKTNPRVAKLINSLPENGIEELQNIRDALASVEHALQKRQIVTEVDVDLPSGRCIGWGYSRESRQWHLTHNGVPVLRASAVARVKCWNNIELLLERLVEIHKG